MSAVFKLTANIKRFKCRSHVSTGYLKKNTHTHTHVHQQSPPSCTENASAPKKLTTPPGARLASWTALPGCRRRRLEWPTSPTLSAARVKLCRGPLCLSSGSCPTPWPGGRCSPRPTARASICPRLRRSASTDRQPFTRRIILDPGPPNVGASAASLHGRGLSTIPPAPFYPRRRLIGGAASDRVVA